MIALNKFSVYWTVQIYQYCPTKTQLFDEIHLSIGKVLLYNQ